MKPNLKNTTLYGFTLLELIVVIAIMGMLATLVVVSFNRQRAQRSVVLAQNETVTNLRKVQSYMLSSRNINGTVPAKYYVITLRTQASGFKPTEILVSALDDSYGMHTVETVKLPEGVSVTDIEVGDGEQKPDPYDCVQIAFSAPFGQMYTLPGGCDDEITQTVSSPVERVTATNKVVTFKLFNPNASTSRQVTLYGLSGRIEAN